MLQSAAVLLLQEDLTEELAGLAAQLKSSTQAIEGKLKERGQLLDGTEAALTAKEFAVLEELVLRAGQVVSKAEILEQVWDFAYEGDPNIVEVYVSALRRKLRPGLIRTVRGAGYRLEAGG